jgi:polysaccharide biosynthesis/export protein
LSRIIRSTLCYGVLFCVLVLVAGYHRGFAQSLVPSQGFTAQAEQRDLFNLFKGKNPSLPLGEDAIFEGMLNPAEYWVGPGDRFSLIFWQPTYMDYAVVVNGEGDLVIPTVGIVRVGGLNLTDARRAVEAEVARVLRVGKISLSLTQPRKLRIHITGQVDIPGTYTLPSTARVADAINLAGGFTREVRFSGVDTTSVFMASLRRIELSDGDGTNFGRADMLLFARGGILKANPHIRDGMTIHVPAPDQSSRQIGVFGAVYYGGLFEHASGDRITDAIAVAGGLTALADSSNALIMSEDGNRRTVNLRSLDDLNLLLRDGDRVLISAFPDTSGWGSVELRGEIVRPGGYPIRIGKTTLREILDQAGGLMPSAATNSARLVRHQKPELIGANRQRVLAAGLAQRGMFTGNVDIGLAAEFSLGDNSTVVLDLHDKDADVPLHDGDILEVPRSPLGIRVLGAVNHAGEVVWESGKRLDDYLAKAGGINTSGWKNRAVVIKARNGSQLRYQSSLSIDPGDVIFVPTKPETTNWDRIKDFVMVTAQVATIVLVVQNIGK